MRRLSFLAIGTLILLVLGIISWRSALVVHENGIETRLDQYDQLIWKHAERSALPSELIKAVIRAESGGDPSAVSTHKAKGLMQIRALAEKDALERLKVEKGDLFDPDYNILIGTTYLKILHDRFKGDYALVLAAYHLGPTRVRKMTKAHPDLSGTQLVEQHVNPSTRAYVHKVLDQR